MLDFVQIVAGLALMLVSAELVVRGAVWFALAFGVSPMVVGLTLVAFGTSAPELAVSLIAALEGRDGFATGNVLGSNIANIGLIVGLTALVTPIRHEPRSARFEVRCLVVVSALVLYPMSVGDRITRWQGVLLLAILALFSFWLVRRELTAGGNGPVARNDPDGNANRASGGAQVPPRATGRAIAVRAALVVVGVAGLIFGGDVLVDGAAAIARRFGMSDTLIGITIFAVGTSLPELLTSIVAARKGHPELALGNVLGSNIFNVCMVFGAVSVVHPLQIHWAQEGPAAVLGVAMATALALSLRLHHGVRRPLAAGFLIAYLGYMAVAVWTV